MSRAEQLKVLKAKYKSAFKSEHGKDVLMDLAIFCGAQKTTFNKDPYVMAAAEGRRQVWLRIQHYLNISDQTLWEIAEREKGGL